MVVIKLKYRNYHLSILLIPRIYSFRRGEIIAGFQNSLIHDTPEMLVNVDNYNKYSKLIH